MGNQTIDRSGPERIAADEQGMKAQREPQIGMAHEFRGGGIDAAISPQPCEIGHVAQHVEQRIERDVAQPFEADAKNRFAVAHEALISAHIAGGYPFDFAQHCGVIGETIEMATIVEHDAIETLERAQIDIVGQFPAAQPPQFLEHKRCSDDGRAGVEAETVLPIDASTASRLVKPLQHRNAITARAETDGGGEPAEAAADYDRMGALPRVSSAILPLGYSGI